MSHTKAFYVTRSIVRGVFYLAIAGISLLAMYAFILGVWSLQF